MQLISDITSGDVVPGSIVDHVLGAKERFGGCGEGRKRLIGRGVAKSSKWRG
ncbi:MAG: hypothetical protein OEU97_06875 [Dehalococcoidia bacterium]|nr:hypothetical protein [Dehalococcoidia bacterium]MDH4299314.1 hypothetical protein [Dehalococcoidia bacterium]MDH4367056.1 hypothetical protein [Dehalococcoidia bacterium]